LLDAMALSSARHHMLHARRAVTHIPGNSRRTVLLTRSSQRTAEPRRTTHTAAAHDDQLSTWSPSRRNRAQGTSPNSEVLCASATSASPRQKSGSSGISGNVGDSSAGVKHAMASGGQHHGIEQGECGILRELLGSGHCRYPRPRRVSRNSLTTPFC